MRLIKRWAAIRSHVISIHASRMGCDTALAASSSDTTDFNPRIPYGMRPVVPLPHTHHMHFNPRIPYGMRLSPENIGFRTGTFQSTHPVWDATSGPVATVGGDRISIHASRMGCDTLTFNDPTVPPYFNPRIPYGMRRPWPPTAATGLSISIHASRMGCDRGDRAAWRKYASHFNPRIPYGMRPASLDPPAACPDFNPRIPYGMRPSGDLADAGKLVISIHASRMGCDGIHRRRWGQKRHFNPRIPYGMRRSGMAQPPHRSRFQSTHPVWDATRGRHARRLPGHVISIHASRMGCDPAPLSWSRLNPYFNPRIPYGMRRSPRKHDRRSNYFNPRIPYGMRRDGRQGTHGRRPISIHASRMGCDCNHCGPASWPSYFNPRIPYGMRLYLTQTM